MIECLPDVNLDQGDSSGMESEDDAEVVPLDFRTALIKDFEGEFEKVVIQAKPMHMKTHDEYMATIEEEEAKLAALKMGATENFIQAMRREAFGEDDEEVILLDPGNELDEKLNEIDLLCNTEDRMNNAIDAPFRPKDVYKKPQAPSIEKQYESDSDIKEKMDRKTKGV
jgi:hypothetical protein